MEEYSNHINMLYSTTPLNSEPAQCAFAIDKKRAITFRHGGHKYLTVDQELQLFPICHQENIKIEGILVRVAVINECADFIVFKIVSGDVQFETYPKMGAGSCDMGMPYALVLMDSKGRPGFKKGNIQKMRHAFVIGTTHSEAGDSGGAVICNNTWIGMVVGKKPLELPMEMVNRNYMDLTPIAEHHSYSIILPAAVILGSLPQDENEDADPLKDKGEEADAKKFKQ